jgi:aminopeptidase N
VLLFNVPLPVRFKTKGGGLVEKTLEVKARAEDFYVPLPEAPQLIRIDPNLTLLARVTFTPPGAMLDAQLADPDDMLGRLLAVEQLSGRKDALEKLKKVLNNDSFHAVRIAAARSLRAIQTDEAFEALRSSLKQGDARVRREVVATLGGFYREATYDVLRQILADEKNPDIQSTAIAGLGAYAKPEVRSALVGLLETKSYRNSIADAAVGAMRAQDESFYLTPLLASLRAKEADFTTGGFARGLGALAWLGRNEEKKDGVREFLLGYLGSRKRQWQQAAINALGTLGDAKALAPLELIASGPKDNPERAAAERAVTSLRDVRKPSVELGSLRGEVLSLQKENRELRKELDELKKKIEALAPKPAPAKPAKARK